MAVIIMTVIIEMIMAIVASTKIMAGVITAMGAREAMAADTVVGMAAVVATVISL